MAVISKHLIDQKISELDEHYNVLKQVLAGSTIEEKDGAYYVPKREMVDNLREINIDKLLTAIGHYRVALDALQRLKSQALKSSGNPMFYPEVEPF
ncbi:hypothetical protein [Azonexus sp.]|uniref:hypothetical protein n=1 Tax=Azonexus sp. TaxID=1872668 RepID=UPI0027B90C3A|nr:hypothetical protein [Azonexus sp.]